MQTLHMERTHNACKPISFNKPFSSHAGGHTCLLPHTTSPTCSSLGRVSMGGGRRAFRETLRLEMMNTQSWICHFAVLSSMAQQASHFSPSNQRSRILYVPTACGSTRKSESSRNIESMKASATHAREARRRRIHHKPIIVICQGIRRELYVHLSRHAGRYCPRVCWEPRHGRMEVL